MAVHFTSPARIQSGVLRRRGRFDLRPGRLWGVLQPKTSLVTVYNGQHYGFTYGLEKCDQH